MQLSLFKNQTLTHSPLNYTGGKYKLLNQLLPLFPSDINKFVDLFCGGLNVSINVQAKRYLANDNLTYLINLYSFLYKSSLSFTMDYINNRIKCYDLNRSNIDGYLNLRKDYNINKNPLDLFILSCYSFNHQIRFNNSHHFNTPFGKDKSHFNNSIKNNLEKFIISLQSKKISFCCYNFEEINLNVLKHGDFVYCDPPYLITSASYNDGKRGFTGWNQIEELKLLSLLDELNNKNIYWALSNVLEHKGLTNKYLFNWVNNNINYKIHYLSACYANSNYQTSSKGGSVEVLITNY